MASLTIVNDINGHSHHLVHKYTTARVILKESNPNFLIFHSIRGKLHSIDTQNVSLQNKTFKNSHTTDNDIGLLKLVRLKYSTIDDVALDIILIS